jgi:hypothetical protein
MRLPGHAARMRIIVIGKPVGKKQLRRIIRRRNDNIVDGVGFSLVAAI